MSPNVELPSTSVLFIDSQSGLDLYRRSQRIDCVVLDLVLPDRSGFQVLINLVPFARRPNVAVITLSHLAQRGMYALARQNGAYACLVKKSTSAEELDKNIQRAIAFVGLMPKEDRYRPI